MKRSKIEPIDNADESINISELQTLKTFLSNGNKDPSLCDEDTINKIYHLLYPSVSYSAVKYNSNIYHIGDNLLIYGKNDTLIGKLVRIIPNNGIKSNPCWPSIEVQWYYKKNDINRKKNNLLNLDMYNSISDYELFPTEHRDVIVIETVIGKCEVYTYEEYENLSEHTEKTFFSRASYDPLSQLLNPKIEEWKSGCVCGCPLNPDQLYIKCDGCNGWFHPKCCGVEDSKAESLNEFFCPLCRNN